MSAFERRALQAAVAIGSLVPIGAGAAGVLIGVSLVASGALVPRDLDSHFRYLSGLLFAIGVIYASMIPRIEAHAPRFRLLTCIVVAGGVGRLVAVVTIGPPSPVMLAALVMELIVTPLLTVW